MKRLLRTSRIAADFVRAARDISMGLYHAAVAGMLVRGGSRMRALSEAPVQRILVLKLDRLGDVILASPFFRELRKNYPNAIITAVTSAESHSLMQSCPYVDQAIPLGVNPLNILGAKRFARSLQARFGSADLTIVPRYCADLYGAGWISFFSEAPVRLTFSEFATARRSRVNRGADALFTHPISSEGTRHEVERNLELLTYLGANVTDDKLEIWPSDQEQIEAAPLLAPLANENSPLIAVGPGASQAKRIWPVDRYAEVCRRLHSATGARFVVMGSRSEGVLLGRFRELLGNAVAVSGSMSLGAVATIFRRCSLFMGSDSAQKHIAAAAGVPVVEVSCFAMDSNSIPARFHAWGVPQLVLQPRTAVRPCHGTCEALEPHCILDVSVDDVEKAAMTLLTSTRTNATRVLI
jgi:ADP-heptose:LPS heptosyltransferase